MRTIAVIGLTNLGVTLARLLAATNRIKLRWAWPLTWLPARRPTVKW